MSRRIALRFIVVLLVILIGSSLSYAKESRDIKFAVFSDPHLYSKFLGTTGTAFETYLAQDRKLLRESEAILDSAIDSIIEEGVRFVLVPGDLTKDGERFNHFLFALKMKKFEKAGIQVFVVPGNHDINNPHAYIYQGDQTISIPNVSPQMFKWIYHQYGYGQALFKDPNSLSYVAEPVKGVWLIAMDSCNYDSNEANGEPATDGGFSSETQAWILKMIKRGKEHGKQLIGMMHHGVLEHYTGQSVSFPDYVVAYWETVSKSFAEAGLEVVFTGHYHANDITKYDFEGGAFLFDIETGSLVTSPCPYRIIDFNRTNKSFKIKTLHVNSIASHPTDFPAYAQDFLQVGMTGIVGYQLSQPPYNLTGPTLTYVTNLVVPAFMAHYAGDESPDQVTKATYGSMMESPDPVTASLGLSLCSLWTDLTPEDNNTTITVDH